MLARLVRSVGLMTLAVCVEYVVLVNSCRMKHSKYTTGENYKYTFTHARAHVRTHARHARHTYRRIDPESIESVG